MNWYHLKKFTNLFFKKPYSITFKKGDTVLYFPALMYNKVGIVMFLEREQGEELLSLTKE